MRGRTRQHAVFELGADVLAGLLERALGDVDRVRPHVGDQADGFAAHVDALVQLLGDDHRAPRGEAELAAGLLLQGAGGERRIGVALLLTFADSRDRPGRAIQVVLDGLRLDAGLEIDLFAGALDQAGDKLRRALARARARPASSSTRPG